MSSIFSSCLTVFVCTFAASCGTSVVPETVSSGGAGGATADSSSTSGGSAVTGLPAGNLPPAACTAPLDPVPEPSGTTAFEGLLAHLWLYCSGDYALGPTDQVGLELIADKTWYALHVQQGSIVRVTDGRYRGTWEASYIDAHNYQLTLKAEEPPTTLA